MDQTSTLTEVMRSCKCFPHVSKMSTLTYNWVNSVVMESAIILNILNIFKYVWENRRCKNWQSRHSQHWTNKTHTLKNREKLKLQIPIKKSNKQKQNRSSSHIYTWRALPCVGTGNSAKTVDGWFLYLFHDISLKVHLC